MTDVLDVDRLRIRSTPRATTRRAPPHKKGLFIKGPLYFSWLGPAGRLPGRALHVALLVAYKSRMTKSEVVTLTKDDLAHFNIDRHTLARALKALEKADLLLVTRTRGRKPRIGMLFG